jgi:protein-serine/threonine kinase
MKKVNEDLMFFVERNDIKGLFNLLEKNNFADPNTQGLNEWTSLHVASSRGFKEICRVLIGFGASINARTSIGRTPLHLASIHNHLDVVLMLINRGCLLDILDFERNSALHHAASLGLEDIVEALLQAKASVDCLNYLQRTPVELSLNIHTLNVFLAYNSSLQVSQSFKSYSRTVFNECLRHNSREDHVSQLLLRATKGHNKSDLSIFENRPKLDPQLKNQRFHIDMPFSKTRPKDFKLILQLGKGSFGFVYLVEKIDSKERFAMKVLDKSIIFHRKIEKYAFTERNILMRINHPFIVRLHFAFQTYEKLALVLDYCPNGDLGQMILREKSFTEEVAKFYICEVILALKELHSHKILFRDLKPDNILIDSEGHLKLTDFGLSKENIDHRTLARSFCGSAAYFAPEMVKREGHTYSIDWYVLGAILFEMVSGRPPYYSPDRNSLFRNIEKAKLEFSDHLSEEIRDLITKLLIRNPKKRLGSGKKGALEIMEHRFFHGTDWNMVLEKRITPPVFKKIQRIEKKLDFEKVFGKLEECSSEEMQLKNWSVYQNNL